jgi:probable rRNA maturation factor
MLARRFRVEVRNQCDDRSISLPSLRRAAVQILKCLGFRGASLNLLLVDDRTMKAYHRRHLGKNRPTDVMAFSYAEGKKMAVCPENTGYLGDVLISAETAKRCSPEYGNTLREEVLLYLCHGILHLTGWRDGSRQEREEMERRQQAILKKIGGGSRGREHGHSKN